ncbi:HIGH CHLOROPHYLL FLUORESCENCE 153 [Olea europaea subsp. europaea]|nr:HIGH CHLOROPHYLL FLUORESCENCE 153 [Olea europaea subsp. europaea]
MASYRPVSCSTRLHFTHNYDTTRLPLTLSLNVHSTAQNLKGRYRNTSSRRRISVVPRAGPSTSSYIFAFVLPISLLAVTVVTSMRIVDKLDQKFLEEVAINQAILEAKEDEDEVNIPLENEPAAPRTRNRPKREVEPSSK